MTNAKHAWHAMKPEEALKALKGRQEGLSEEEAKRRLERSGPNRLPTEPAVAWWRILLRQFANPLILILVAAAAISFALNEAVDAAVISAAVLLNTLIGYAQEYKADRALERLRAFVQPKAVVRRGGGEREIDAAQVVPGDILVLKAGDRIVADARLLAASALEADESALTGESLPAEKRVEADAAGTRLAERAGMVYAGTGVAAGHALAVVVATGTGTELGRIAELVQGEREGSTPLQAEIQRLARWISLIVAVLVAVLFGLGVWKGAGIFEMFETSVAVAVAAVPEGLVIAITAVLAIGAQRIYRRKALVRRLVAAETLGSVSVICTDKTGTLTEGIMRVSEVVPPDRRPGEAVREGRVLHAKDTVFALEIAMLCNDATVNAVGGLAPVEVLGSPTEKALMEAGSSSGISLAELSARHPRHADIPFDSTHKYMATVNGWGRGRAVLMKGAPERVLPRCSGFMRDGETHALTASRRKEIEAAAASMAGEGLRVIALAFRAVSTGTKGLKEDDLTKLSYAGLIGLRDPLRKEARANILAARAAGVRTVLITGDHADTAFAIGSEAGLVSGKRGVVQGSALDDWTDEELERHVPDIEIYARAEPHHKIRIVKALRARGASVAMLGDGVNDAPALKAADIGVALGSGTEVAKQASDLVLLDNNLATVTAAIEEGRIIFDNIRKTTVYLMLDSFTEIILIAGALALELPMPWLAVHILWVNLVADSLPAVALTLEPGEPDVMRLPPRPRGERVLNADMRFFIFRIGILTDIALFAVFLWYLAQSDGDLARVRSVMFAALGLYSLIYVFALKSFRRSLFRTNPFSNPWLNLAVVGGLALMALALFHPWLTGPFGVVPLSLSDWTLLLMIGLLKLAVIELTKEWVFRRRRTTATA